MWPFNSSRPIIFTNAQVLGPDGVIAASLRIERGCIAALDAAPKSSDLAIDLGGALIIPGLINAHDHLEHNNFARLKWRDRYTNAREWIADFQPRFKTDPALIEPMSVSLRDRLLFGGIKNLLSGVTTVCHHNPMHRELRRSFIVRVVQRFRYSHSLLIDGEGVAGEYQRTPEGWPWIIHAAEGTDVEAANELEQLDRLGCLGSKTVLVHGVGLTAPDRKKLIERGGALIWCPSSNDFLLGATAEIKEFSFARRAALGTDSRLSGERDLLAEMKVAWRTDQVDAQAIFRMVTVDAAAILHLPQAGRLSVGVAADLVILPAGEADPFASVVKTNRSELRLVMIGGRPQIGDPDMWPLFVAAEVKTERVCLDGREKVMAAALVNRLHRCLIREAGFEIGQ
jgi:cytosine/adenosine deaminase-related metal-dependent hydrolase